MNNDNVIIRIDPADVWASATANRKELEDSYMVIAMNKETCLSVCVTCDEDDTVYLAVLDADDEEIYTELVVSASDARLVCAEMIEDYLTDEDVQPEYPPGSSETMVEVLTEEDPMLQQEIDNREEQLFCATVDFLDTVFQYEVDSIELLGEDNIGDIMDRFLEVLGYDYGLSVYRPTIIDTNSGECLYVEYPYDAGVLEAGLS